MLGPDVQQLPGGGARRHIIFAFCPLYFAWIILSYLMPSHFIGILFLGTCILFYFFRGSTPLAPRGDNNIEKERETHQWCKDVERPFCISLIVASAPLQVFNVCVRELNLGTPSGLDWRPAQLNDISDSLGCFGPPMASKDLSKRTLKYFIGGLSAAEHQDDWNAAAEKFIRNRHLVQTL